MEYSLKVITCIIICLFILSCSDNSAQKEILKLSICMSNPKAETFEADKNSYLAKRGKSIPFTLNIINLYNKLDIPNDSRVILRGLIRSPGRYKSKKIISNGFKYDRYRKGFIELQGLKHYVYKVGVPDNIDYDAHNEKYRDTFISNTDDYLLIICTRLTEKLVSPSCKIDYMFKNVNVNYYISRVLLDQWNYIKADVDKYLDSIDICKA